MTAHHILLATAADAVVLATCVGLCWLAHLVYPHDCPWRDDQRSLLRRLLRLLRLRRSTVDRPSAGTTTGRAHAA